MFYCYTLVCVYSKVVRRVSVNERSSLYRREHHKEAMVWQERGRQTEPQDEDEDRQTDSELNQHTAMVSEHSVLDLFKEHIKELKLFTLSTMFLFCFRLLLGVQHHV